MDEKIIKKVGLVVTILIGIITIYFQIFPPTTTKEKISSLLLLFAVIFYIVIYLSADQIITRVREQIKKIDNNEKEILEIKKKMDTESKFHELDKRIALLEQSKNKKGNIDIRIIILIALIILFILYLKAIGILK